MSPLPLRQFVLLFFVTFLGRTFVYASVKVNISSLQFYSSNFGFPERITDMPQLYSLLRGIRRVQGSSRSRPRRPAITIGHLLNIVAYCTAHIPHPNDQIMLRSAVTLAFFGMLRVSEYTSATTTSYNPDTTLMFADVSISLDRQAAILQIKASKMDPFRRGCSIRLSAIDSVLCPVTTLLGFIAIHPSSGPLYVFADGTFLTRGFVVSLLRRCYCQLLIPIRFGLAEPPLPPLQAFQIPQSRY